MWAPKQETGLGLRWRPRRPREVAGVSGTGAGGCQRRCGGAAAAARRRLLAGTAPLRRTPPTADTGPAPSVAPPILPHSAVLPEPEAPPPKFVALGHAHSLVAPPTTGLLGFLGSIDWRPAALAPPRSRWTTPSPVQGPAAPPGSDFLPGDRDRRAASGTRLADAAAEPAWPLKGTSRLGSARFLLYGALSSTSSAKEAPLLSHPNSPDPKFPRGAIHLGLEGLRDHSIRRSICIPPHFSLGVLPRIRPLFRRHVSHAVDPGRLLDCSPPRSAWALQSPLVHRPTETLRRWGMVRGWEDAKRRPSGNDICLLSLGCCPSPAHNDGPPLHHRRSLDAADSRAGGPFH